MTLPCAGAGGEGGGEFWGMFLGATVAWLFLNGRTFHHRRNQVFLEAMGWDKSAETERRIKQRYWCAEVVALAFAVAFLAAALIGGGE